jgi:hypothetical protein
VNLLERRGGQTLAAAAGYALLTVVMTWPVAAAPGRTIPGDLGDSLLVMGVMAWVSEALVAIARGELPFAALWDANFFAPTPLALTFSEHFVPQAVQGLPAYLATGNVLLAYDVVFLATFALSGLGTFLLVRELTGSAAAGFVAGLFYAFFPYRLTQFAHLQTLSSQWVPFTLFGFRRYFATGRRLPLAGGTAAFVVQGLSSGYYLFFLAPILAGYVLWEMTARGRLRDWRGWRQLFLAGGSAILATLPFLLPYAEARERFGLSRGVGEVLTYSADLYAYLNAPHQLRLWGSRLTMWPQTEGDLFPGVVPLLLGAAGAAAWAVRSGRDVVAATGLAPGRERVAGRVGLAVAGALVIAAGLVAVTGGFVAQLGPLPIRMTNVRRTLTYAAAAAAVGLLLSRPARAALARRAGDLTPFLVAAIAFCVVMSLGPAPHAGGERLVGLGLYAVFFERVPGYDGLRVPARYGMLAGALLATLAGYALARLAAGRAGKAALTALAVAFLAEAWAVPVPTNLTWSSSTRYAAPWPTVHPVNDGPLAYRYLLGMSGDMILIELPFGDHAWDLRYVYYAGLHGKRIVNGYSGYFPDGYRARAARLAAVWADRNAAWEAVRTSGATHLLVHRHGYVSPEGDAIAGWAEQSGGVPLVEFADGDVLMALPPADR